MKMNRFIKAGLALAICSSLLISAITIGQIFYMKGKAVVAQWLLERAWQQQLEQKERKTTGVKPWPWADMYPIAKLDIPSQGQSFVIVNTDSGQALAFAPGLNGVSNRNNYIISGHNDTHFKQLGKLTKSDEITLTTLNNNRIQSKRFYVLHTEVFDSKKSQLMLDQSNEQAQLLLITCYPFHSGQQTSKRFVVVATEKKETEEQEFSEAAVINRKSVDTLPTDFSHHYAPGGIARLSAIN